MNYGEFILGNHIQTLKIIYKKLTWGNSGYTMLGDKSNIKIIYIALS